MAPLDHNNEAAGRRGNAERTAAEQARDTNARGEHAEMVENTPVEMVAGGEGLDPEEYVTHQGQDYIRDAGSAAAWAELDELVAEHPELRDDPVIKDDPALSHRNADPIVEDVQVAMQGDADDIIAALDAFNGLVESQEAAFEAQANDWLPTEEELNEYFNHSPGPGTYVLLDDGEYAWFGNQADAAAASQMANGSDTLEEMTAQYDGNAARAAADLRAADGPDLDTDSGSSQAEEYAAGTDQDLTAGEGLST